MTFNCLAPGFVGSLLPFDSSLLSSPFQRFSDLDINAALGAICLHSKP